MTPFNPQALLNLSTEDLFNEAGKFFTEVFENDKDKIERAMTFLLVADTNIGNTLRNRMIDVIQSNQIDDERASRLIDEFLERNPPPSDEDAMKLMVDPQELNDEESRLAALYLLQQPDLRRLYTEILIALVPDLRIHLVTAVLETPIGSREQLNIDVAGSVNDQITDAVTSLDGDSSNSDGC